MQIDADHIEACRRHVEVGARISVSGTKALIEVIDRQQAEIERLREIIHGTPILKIDVRAARILGEDEAVAYAKSLAAWAPNARAIIHPKSTT